MNPASEQLLPIFLRPGELVICREPSLVTTLLGSCVAVTMFSPGKRIGAICHALLPQPRQLDLAHAANPEIYKYVSLAIPAMLDKLGRHQIVASELQVKLFGGSSVLATPLGEDSPSNIGALNVRHARQVLEAANLRLLSSHVGGTRGHKLLFNTATGEVLIKHLSHHAKSKNQSLDCR